MKNFIKDGKMMTFTADRDYLSGEIVVVGDLVGVCAYDVLTGAQGEMSICGVYKLPKAVGEILAGQKVYTVGDEIVLTDTEPAVGYAYEYAASDATEIAVILRG